MVAGSSTETFVSPVSLDRLWRASGDSRALLPKLLPEVITSIDLLEGDGGVGSVKQFNFVPGPKDFTYIKDRVDTLDHTNHIYAYTILEGGDIGKTLKSSSFEAKWEATSEGGSLLTVKWDYETLGDPLSEAQVAEVMTGVLSLSKVVAAHLEANPDAYV